jgi:hypothetical protein
MKKLFGIVVLSLFLITPSQADDIRDFQIEGMSIGDSLLDYLSKKEILSGKQNYYKSDEFIPVYIDDYKNSSAYEGLQFHYKKGDQKYKIVALEGVLFFADKSKISKCHKKQNEILNEIKTMFSRYKIETYQGKHSQDSTGKSSFKRLVYKIKNDYIVSIDCYDWHKKMGYPKNLRVSIVTANFQDWANTKAYK